MGPMFKPRPSKGTPLERLGLDQVVDIFSSILMVHQRVNLQVLEGLCITMRRNCVEFFLESFGCKESNVAELLGIRRALSLGCNYGLVNLIIEGDSMNVLAWTSGRKEPSCSTIHIVRAIRKLTQGRVVQFRHVKRSANFVVDFLAKVSVDRVDPYCLWVYGDIGSVFHVLV